MANNSELDEILDERVTCIAHDVDDLLLYVERDATAREKILSKLGENRQKLRAIIEIQMAELEAVCHQKRTRTRRTQLQDKSKSFVRSSLVDLDIALRIERFSVPRKWIDDSGILSARPEGVFALLHDFEQQLSRRCVIITSPTYHMLATAFRVFADQSRLQVSTSAGWLGIAPRVTAELRFRYHHYRTCELWARVGSGFGGPVRHPTDFARALGRSLYGMVSGYGLRGRNFAVATASIVLVFACVYWYLMTPGSFIWQNIVNAMFKSLSAFTTVGNIGEAAGDTESAIRVVATLESVIGYTMLGVLASVFWTSFHESVTASSAIRIDSVTSTALRQAPADDGY